MCGGIKNRFGAKNNAQIGFYFPFYSLLKALWAGKAKSALCLIAKFLAHKDNIYSVLMPLLRRNNIIAANALRAFAARAKLCAARCKADTFTR